MSNENNGIFYRLGLFLLFFGCGWVALGPIQWGNITISELIKIIYKIGIPIIFFLITFYLYKSKRLNKYWSVFYFYTIGATAFLITWLLFFLFPIQTTTAAGYALAKLYEAVLIIGPIIIILLIFSLYFHSN